MGKPHFGQVIFWPVSGFLVLHQVHPQALEQPSDPVEAESRPDGRGRLRQRTRSSALSQTR